MAQTHLSEVLKATGLPEDQIKALTDLPEDTKDFKTETYLAPIQSTFETKIKNDAKFYEGLNKENLPKEFLKTLEAEQYGRSASVVRSNLLKNVGMTEKDFADLGEDGKKLDLFIPAFAKRLSEGKVGDKELQAKLIEANQEIEKLKGQAPELEVKFKHEFDVKMNEFQVNEGIVTSLSSIQGLKAPAKFLKDNIAAQLRSKYALVSENGVIEIRQKDKPTLKALTANGTKELTLSDAITQILDAENLIDKKATTTSQVNMRVSGAETGLKVSSHVKDKMEKLMAEDKLASGG